MKRKVFLLATTILLLSSPAVAAEKKRILPPPPPDSAIVRPSMPRAAGSGSASTVAPAKAENVVTVSTGGPYVATNNQAQRFSDYLDVKPGQKPLRMRIENNGFQWFRINLSGQLVATEKSLRGKNVVEIDITDIAQAGSNQVAIQAGGTRGSELSWKVTSLPQPKLDKVDPDEAIIEDEIKLQGSNFSTDSTANKVFFNKKQGNVTKSTVSELKVKIPKDADIGENKVFVKVEDRDSNLQKMKIRGIPEITGTNLQGVAPGQELIIYGKNFSKNLGENKVYFGDSTASVIGGDQTHLIISAPGYGATPAAEAMSRPMNVKVQVGKIASKNSVPVMLSPKMYQDPGVYVGPDTPVLGPGFDVGSPGGVARPNEIRNNAGSDD